MSNGMKYEMLFEPMPVDRLGEVFVKSGLFTDVKREEEAIVKILAGREIGFPPVASMNNIYIIDGKMAIAPALMAAKIKGSGKYDYRVKFSNEACEITFYENGQVLGVSKFSMDDARRAGLVGRRTWQQYPRNLLFARAMSNGCRWFCPDIYNGAVYTPEELGVEVNESGEPVSPSPQEPVPPSPQVVDVAQVSAEERKPAETEAPPPPETASTGDLGAALLAQSKEKELIRAVNKAIFHKLSDASWDEVKPYAPTLRELLCVRLEAGSLEELLSKLQTASPEMVTHCLKEVMEVG